MPSKKPFAEIEEIEALIKLLDKNDLETAQLIRRKLTAQDASKLKLLDDADKEKLLQKLKKLAPRSLRLAVNPTIIPPKFAIKKTGITLPPVWPLSIDRSFWEDWAFVKWQAVRRNDFYRRAIERFYKPNPAIFQSSEIDYLFQDYTLSCESWPDGLGYTNNPFAAWCIWARLRKAVRLNIEEEVTERLARRVTIKKLDLWPVKPSVCFPHPDFLDKLLPLRFGIPLQPVNRKGKTPLYSMHVETGLQRLRYLKLDVSPTKGETKEQSLGLPH